MTVALSTRQSGPYTATAGQTVFNYTFPIDNASELKVKRLRGTTEVTLELDVDYGVTAVGSDEGTIILTSGSVAGDIVDIDGSLPIQRVSNFAGWKSIPDNAINKELDRMIKALQEMRRDVDGSIHTVQAGTAYDVQGGRLINVADGVDPNDAVTMEQLANIDPVQFTPGLPTISAVDLDNDFISVWDASVGGPRKMTPGALGEAIIGEYDVEVFKGFIDCSGNPVYPAASAGDVYRVSAAGKIGGASGVVVEVNDRLECSVDNSPAGNQASVGANWGITQSNIDIGFRQPDTIAEASTLTVPAPVLMVRVLGRVTVGDGGLSLWKRVGSLPSHPGYFQDASGAYFEYASEQVNLVAMGSVGDFTTDDTTAITNAFAVANAQDKAIYVNPGKDFVVTSTITLNSRFRIYGAGMELSRIWLLDANTRMFQVAMSGFNIENCEVRDVRFACKFSTVGAAHNLTAAFRFTGSAEDLFQWSEFVNLRFDGFTQAFINDITPRTTGFGLEGGVNWCHFENIKFRAGVNCYPLYGFLHNQGSGTGNKYVDWNGAIGDTASPGVVFVFNGTGCVVGDIIVTGGQWLAYGAVGGRLVTIGDNTVYRQRILISDVQLDAGMDYYITGSGTGSTLYSNIKLLNCNIGGGVKLTSTPVLLDSVMYDQEVSEWKAGNYKKFDTTGATTVSVFSITLSSYTAVRVSFLAAGIVGGVNAGAAYNTYMIRTDASTATVAAGTAQSTDTAVVTLSTSVAGLVVTFKFTCAPSSAGTGIDAQIEAKGGKFLVQRL